MVDTHTALAAVGGLGAAFLFGMSSVMMFRAANAAPSADVLRFRLLTYLVHSRLWIAGVLLQAMSFGVQALALSLGPLSLVQPLAAMDLVFALPLLARAQHRSMGSSEWFPVALIVGGVVLFLGISPPRGGVMHPRGTDWLLALSLAGTAVLLTAALALRSTGIKRTTLLAVAGAIDFAVLDALTKSVTGNLRTAGVLPTLTDWEVYLLLAAGVGGLLLSQSAFQSGSLQVSLPVFDTLEPVGAVLLGILVFREALARSSLALTAQLCAAVLALIGIVWLDRSPLAQR